MSGFQFSNFVFCFHHSVISSPKHHVNLKKKSTGFHNLNLYRIEQTKSNKISTAQSYDGGGTRYEKVRISTCRGLYADFDQRRDFVHQGNLHSLIHNEAFLFSSLCLTAWEIERSFLFPWGSRGSLDCPPPSPPTIVWSYRQKWVPHRRGWAQGCSTTKFGYLPHPLNVLSMEKWLRSDFGCSFSFSRLWFPQDGNYRCLSDKTLERSCQTGFLSLMNHRTRFVGLSKRFNQCLVFFKKWRIFVF